MLENIKSKKEQGLTDVYIIDDIEQLRDKYILVNNRVQ